MNPEKILQVFRWSRLIAVAVFIAIITYVSIAHTSAFDFEMSVIELMQARSDMEKHDNDKKAADSSQAISEGRGTYQDVENVANDSTSA